MAMRTAITLAALALPGCGAQGDGPQVSVQDAMVTLPAVPGRPGAGYFTLTADREGVRLVGIASPRAGRIEMHGSGMRGVASFPIPAGEPLAFAPGGRHAMVHALDESLRPGGRVPLTFTFEGAPAVTAEAEVRAPGDVPSAH